MDGSKKAPWYNENDFDISAYATSTTEKGKYSDTKVFGFRYIYIPRLFMGSWYISYKPESPAPRLSPQSTETTSTFLLSNLCSIGLANAV